MSDAILNELLETVPINAKVTLKEITEVNKAGDLITHKVIIKTSRNTILENLPCNIAKSGTTVFRNIKPEYVITNPRLVIPCFVDNITESSLAIIQGVEYLIDKIVSNNEFFTVLELRKVSI